MRRKGARGEEGRALNLAAEEIVSAVCRHFGVRLEELAMTGQTPCERVRSARAACGMLAVPAGLAIIEMGRRIGYATQGFLTLRRRYWACYRYDQRGFRPRFKAICLELGLPAQDQRQLRKALGFPRDASLPDQLVEAVCQSFGISRQELRQDDESPVVRRARAACALLVRKMGVRLRPGTLGSGLPGLQTLFDWGRCMLEFAQEGPPSDELKAFCRRFEQACQRLQVDTGIPAWSRQGHAKEERSSRYEG